MPMMLHDEASYIINCIRDTSVRLSIINDVVIIGSIGECLAGSRDCSTAHDVDIFITNEAVGKFWEFIHSLLNCKPDDLKGFRFQPVYDLLVKPPIVKDSWKPCQCQYYAHPLALTINCGRHLRFIQGSVEDKRVNLDIKVLCSEVVKIPNHEYFLSILGKGKVNEDLIREKHEEFMVKNCEKADFKEKVLKNKRLSNEINLYYAVI